MMNDFQQQTVVMHYYQEFISKSHLVLFGKNFDKSPQLLCAKVVVLTIDEHLDNVFVGAEMKLFHALLSEC